MIADLRQFARGRICQIRIPGVCQHRVDTVVLAHYRLSSLAGMALKPHDLIGAHGCQACHDVVDGRVPRPPGITRQDVRLWHAEGVMRTQNLLINEGFELIKRETA